MPHNQMRYISYISGNTPQDMHIAKTPLPEVGEGEMLIRVKAFGVNRADTLQRQGKYPAPKGESPILGLEVAGSICQLGKGVKEFALGDRVFGLVAGGGYAEFVKIRADHAMKTPAGLSDVQAAGVAEVFLTAYQSLFALANTQPGQKVLIHAGASGVGLAAIQLAIANQNLVAVTSSNEEKLATCAKAGASLLINYQDACFVSSCKENHFYPDTIIDFVGADYLTKNLKILNQDGTIIQLAMLGGRFAESVDMALLLAKRAVIKGSTLRNRSDIYKAKLVENFSKQHLASFDTGQLAAHIDTVFAAKDIYLAHQRLESNQSIGKFIGKW